MGARRGGRELTVDTRAWLDAWNGPDGEAVVATTDPEVEVIAVLLGTEARRYLGHDGVRQWMREIPERFHARTVAHSLTPLADDVLLLDGTLWIADGFGAESDQSFAIVMHLRRETAIWIGTFVSEADAQTAYEAGLTGPRSG